MQIEQIKTEKLIPYARNSRLHSPEQVAQISASIREFGFNNPVLIDKDHGIIAGHGRVLAAQKLGLDEIPCLRLSHLTDIQKRAYIIADNRLTETGGGWDTELLALEIEDLRLEDFDIDLTGFDADALDAMFEGMEEESAPGLTDEDQVPEAPEEPVSKLGDVWILGRHRVMCGDSTSIDAVNKLMDGKTAALLHADPPYGMGKEGDGVANDNLYAADLDRFQMEWWATFRTFIDDNASAYIWGNAPDLWRLWYAGGLGNSEKLELRNEIVWDKKSIAGMASPDLTQYPVATERCLFFQLGNQFLGNVNAADFPESWEPVRDYMESQAKAAGVNPAEIKRVCGCGMYSHWFTKSQFTLIPEKHYRNLASEYPGHFAKPWKELKSDWDRVKGGPNSEVQGARSYFDNAHEPMRDVWEFSRVTNEERFGHATPKPVAMIVRVMKSSLPTGGLCAEPFGGSGSTLMGAEKSGRICYSMELQPKYVDVIVRRWCEYTGNDAILESTGEAFPS